MPRVGSRRGRTGWVQIGLPFVCAVAVLSAALATPTSGAVVSCGAVLNSSVRLSSDVGPCQTGGIIVAASNVVIDLNGHRIIGSPGTGDGVGIRLQSVSGVVVKKGTIANFDAGIVIAGGSANKVTKVRAVGNIGAPGGLFGDGILITGSSSNLVRENEVRSNGPFSGISVFGQGAAGNKVSRNVVQDNDLPSGADNVDIGIRLDRGSSQTTVKENRVSFSGLDGIGIFESSEGNVVSRNTLRHNGFHDKAHRKGDGIRLFGDVPADPAAGTGQLPGARSNTITSNVSRENAASGVYVETGARLNQIERNKTGDNGLADPVAADLVDENEGCDNNTWVDNTGTRNRACIQ